MASCLFPWLPMHWGYPLPCLHFGCDMSLSISILLTLVWNWNKIDFVAHGCFRSTAFMQIMGHCTVTSLPPTVPVLVCLLLLVLGSDPVKGSLSCTPGEQVSCSLLRWALWTASRCLPNSCHFGWPLSIVLKGQGGGSSDPAEGENFLESLYFSRSFIIWFSFLPPWRLLCC
jgi:hypothetical protein